MPLLGPKPNRRLARALVGGALALSVLGVNPVTSAAASRGVGSCPNLPADNVWHAAVSALPVSPLSGTYVRSIGLSLPLHPDFGRGNYGGGPIGIPYNVVPASQPLVPVRFTYTSESDPGPYPIPPKALIEGGPHSTGDRHVLVVNSGTCKDYELFAGYPRHGGTSWRAGSGAVFDLNSDGLRPAGFTSADAAGLPILPGLVRYDEVAAGVIDHAVRVTVSASDASYLWPARHQAGTTNSALPPMGLRLRVKASVDISGYPPVDRVILQALKSYGMLVADNGTSWFISGVPDPRWDNSALHQLTQITGSDFEAVDESCLMVGPDSAASNPAHCH